VIGFDRAVSIRDFGTSPDVFHSVLWSRPSKTRTVALVELLSGEDPKAIQRLLDPRAHNHALDPLLANPFDPNDPVFRPFATPSDTAMPPDDGFFDSSARYVGALGDAADDWTRAPWVRWN
jgi:hypothetical protein